MARARKASDDIYNARRRAKRAVASMEKELARGTSPERAKALRGQIANLQAGIQDTYSSKPGKPGTKAQQARRKVAAETLTTQVGFFRAEQKRNTGRQARANAAFRAEMMRAAKGDMRTRFGADPDIKMRVFWQVTRSIWGDKRNIDRAQAIMAHFGTASLEEAYNKVMNSPNAANYLTKLQKLIAYNTDEAINGFSSNALDEAAMEDFLPGEEEHIGSPDAWEV